MNSLDRKMLVMNCVPIAYMFLMMTTAGSELGLHRILEQNHKFDNVVTVCALGCLILAPCMLLSSFYHKLKAGEGADIRPFYISCGIFALTGIVLFVHLRIFDPQWRQVNPIAVPVFLAFLFSIIPAAIYAGFGFLLKKLVEKEFL